MFRWTRGLKATGWHQVNTLAQLRQKWNDLATPVAGVTNTPPKPRNEALTPVGGGVETPEQFRKRQAELKRRLTAQGEPLMPELKEKWYAKNDALVAAGRVEDCDPDYLYKKGIKL